MRITACLRRDAVGYAYTTLLQRIAKLTFCNQCLSVEMSQSLDVSSLGICGRQHASTKMQVVILWKFYSSSEKAQILSTSGTIKNGSYCMWDALGLALLYPKDEEGAKYSLQLAPKVQINKAHQRRPPVEGSADRPLYLQECPTSNDVHLLLSRHGLHVEGWFERDPKFADAMRRIDSMIQAKPPYEWE